MFNLNAKFRLFQPLFMLVLSLIVAHWSIWIQLMSENHCVSFLFAKRPILIGTFNSEYRNGRLLAAVS